MRSPDREPSARPRDRAALSSARADAAGAEPSERPLPGRERAATPPPGPPVRDVRPLRVLDLINTSESAKELLLARTLQLRDRHGIEGHVLCSSGPYVGVLRARGIPVHVLDTPRSLRPLALARALVRIVRLVRAGRYDVVHSHGSVLGLLGRLCRPFTGAAVVHTVHGFHFHDGMSPTRAFLWRAAERSLLPLSDLVLSQNRADTRELLSWGSRTRVELIGNGIRLPAEPPPYRAEPRAEYRLACVARFEPVKDHRLLLDAFARVLEAGVPARLACFGAGELMEEMKAHARRIGIADRVAFRGYVDDAMAELEGTDLNLLTSRKEGLPRSLIEALALGVPSVATDVKGSREVVEDGVTGLLVPPGDPDAFARAVVELLRDPARRRRMSRASVARARELYDERRVVDRLAALYREVAPRAAARLRAPIGRRPTSGERPSTRSPETVA